jgi:hypothetical protein
MAQRAWCHTLRKSTGAFDIYIVRFCTSVARQRQRLAVARSLSLAVAAAGRGWSRSHLCQHRCVRTLRGHVRCRRRAPSVGMSSCSGESRDKGLDVSHTVLVRESF